MRELLRELNLDAIYVIDFETYWANDYTLAKLPTTEYITDPRFEAQIVSVLKHNWTKPRVMEMAAFKRWLKTVDWKRSGVLAHHAHFDGLIASRYFGLNPAMYFDTISMGNVLLPVTVSRSLKSMCAVFGRNAKLKAGALVDTKGKRWKEFTRQEKTALKSYAGDDTLDCLFLFEKMRPYLPYDELRLIDLTIRMYAQPSVEIYTDEMRAVTDGEKDRKAKLLKQLKLTKADLSENKRFIPLLEAEGIDVPMKLSPAVAKRLEEDELPTPEDFIPALSKSDLAFKQLLVHENKRVRLLVEARFAVKSTNLEKKAERLADRSVLGAVPVYLNHAKAKTLRWTGGDSVNWQNMNRGSDMRRAIHAPKGHVFIIADQAQIEARFNAWYSGQDDIVAVFRQGEDVYAVTASGIYGRLITKETDPDERFVGKTATLGLGYQAGAKRFAGMLRIGQFGPPIDVSDEEAQNIVRNWRQKNYAIVNGWKETHKLLSSAFASRTRIEHRYGIVYEGKANGVGYIHHTPTGLSMRYDGVEFDDTGKLSYVSEAKRKKVGPPTLLRTKLYGGIEVENRTQFLGRISVGLNAIEIARTQKRKKVLIANTTHDELLCVVPIRHAERVLRDVIEIMETPLDWAPGMPFGVDAHISERYDK